MYAVFCVTGAFDSLDFFVVNSIVWKSVAVSPAFCAPSFTVWEGEWGTCVFWRENYHNMTLPPPPFPLLPGSGGGNSLSPPTPTSHAFPYIKKSDGWQLGGKGGGEGRVALLRVRY